MHLLDCRCPTMRFLQYVQCLRYSAVDDMDAMVKVMLQGRTVTQCTNRQCPACTREIAHEP